MRNGLTQKDLDSLKIPYTQSQLLLLRSQRLVQRQQRVYKTSVPILDEEQTIKLRKQSRFVAKQIFQGIEKNCNELVIYLSKNNRSKNAFSILFSYVLDGLIWNKLEKEKLIEERDGTNIWSGSYWFLTPKRPFECGTNSMSAGRNHKLSINWTNQSQDLLNNLFNANCDEFLYELEKKNTITAAKLIEEFKPFGFFDKNNHLTIPVINENSSDTLFSLSNHIVDKILSAFIKTTNTEELKTIYHFKDNNESIVIFYHEVMWDILNLLLENQTIQIPIIFDSPEKADVADIADVCFLVTNKE
ncbi:hypothetical protein FACS1894156_4290 [Bacteroidia bacterium]|nr:hypothetical protein FACS1894156_4290 [Bacteroidia bacterium]